jgi:hypothetical protein
VAASLRNGPWNDTQASIEPFHVKDLLKVVQSFGHQPIYGCEFFDLPEERLQLDSQRLSLDLSLGSDGRSHSICFFQEEGGSRFLEIWIWFDDLVVNRAPDMKPLTIEEFIAGGKGWWDGLHAGDSRTTGAGILPGSPFVVLYNERMRPIR